MERLTIKEYADLRGCTVQYAGKLILERKLEAEETYGAVGRAGRAT